MPICHKCGKGVSAEAFFCTYCGAQLRTSPDAQEKETQPQTNFAGQTEMPPPPAPDEMMRCNLCDKKVVAREMRLHLANKHSKTWNDVKLTSDALVQERFRRLHPIGPPITEVIHVISRTFDIGAGKYYETSFAVPGEGFNAVLKGTVTVRGGTGNDIEIYVMDLITHVGWEKGNYGSGGPRMGTVFAYNSGRVCDGNINLQLPCGKTFGSFAEGTSYFLVFSNHFSSRQEATKNVSAIIDLYYQRNV